MRSDDTETDKAAEIERRGDVDNRTGAKRERLDPPVGTDEPKADRSGTVAIADLNSADDE